MRTNIVVSIPAEYEMLCDNANPSGAMQIYVEHTAVMNSAGNNVI